MMTCRVDLQARDLSSFKYLYGVKHRSDGVVEREYIVDGNTVRELNIPANHRRDHTWYQYDGVARPDLFALKMLVMQHWKGDHFRYIAAIWESILPDWEGFRFDGKSENRSAEEVVVYVLNITHCYEVAFRDYNGNPLGSYRANEMLTKLISGIVDKLEVQLTDSERSDYYRELTLASAAAVICLFASHFATFDQQYSETLCMALLLKLDNSPSRCQAYTRLVQHHFATSKEFLANSLIAFINRLSKAENVQPLWLLTVPLVHFLCENSRPFDAIAGKSRHNESKNNNWWGTEKFDRAKNNLKEHLKQNSCVDEYLGHLVPLVSFDQLIPRTLMAVISYRNLDLILPLQFLPVDVSLASLYYFVKTNELHDPERLSKFLKSIAARLDNLKGMHVLDESLSTRKFHDLARSAVEISDISFDLLDVACQNGVYLWENAVVDVVDVVLRAISHEDDLATREIDLVPGLQQFQDCNTITDAVNMHFNTLIELLKKWVSKRVEVKTLLTTRDLKLMNKLLELNASNEALRQLWTKRLSAFLQELLKKMPEVSVVSLYATEDFAQYTSPLIEDCVATVACDIVDQLSQSRLDEIMDGDQSWQNDQMGRWISTVFIRFWPVVAKETSHDYAIAVLKHILTWKTFKKFLALQYSSDASRRSVKFTKEYTDRMLAAVEVLKAGVKELIDGSITLAKLKLFENHTHVTELVDIVDKDSTFVPTIGRHFDRKRVLMAVLEWRMAEENEYSKLHKQLSNFIEMTRNCVLSALKSLESKLCRSYDDITIQEICEPKPCNRESFNDEHYKPMITAFGNLDSVQDMIKYLDSVHGSRVFHKIWTGNCSLLQDEYATDADNPEESAIIQVVSRVWKPSAQRWSDLCSKLSSGKMTIQEVDEVFGIFNKDLQLIESEVGIMCERKDLVHVRVQQIQLYHECQRYFNGTKIILDARQQLSLRGDFTGLEAFCKLIEDQKSVELCSLTDSLLESVKLLETIDEEQKACLEVFLDNQSLIEWFRRNLPEPKQVTVLVELAMISAQGQGDFEIERVRCLQAAVRGYDALIYRLEEKNCSFGTFLHLCNEVWQALKSDPTLPAKFRDTVKHREWLENIVETHGSVEDSALKLAKEIDSNAIISVGYLRKGVHPYEFSIDDVILLKFTLTRVISEHNQEQNAAEQHSNQEMEEREMNLHQLIDLQSKLILIVGRNQETENVNRFVELMDAVTRLARTYLDICNAGCTLFHQWKAIFNCDRTRKRNTHVQFDSKSPPLSGYTADVIDHIRIVCKYLKACLDDWTEYVNAQRSHNPYLNFYSAAQLTKLQSELAKLACSSDSQPQRPSLNSHVYNLLWYIKRYVTHAELCDCLKASFKRVEKACHTASASCADVFEQADADHEILVQKHKIFVQELLEAGYEMNVIEKAAISCDLDDIPAAIIWCLEHEHTESEHDSKEEEMISTQQLRQDYTFVDNTSELIRNLLTTDDSLESRLNSLWVNFLSQTSTSVSDYLSLHHLGCFLQELAELSNSLNISRPFPNIFQTMYPNLVICKRTMVFRTILSIYMNEEGKNLPLPGLDEVLMCTSKTTSHEVELFCRRANGDAISKQCNKIYCLAFVDMLDHDVAMHTEKLLEKYCHMPKLQMVVIGCSENEFQSYLIPVLDRHRVDMPIEDIEKIQEYLKCHFVINNSCQGLKNGYRPAGQIDPGKSSVRVIKSYRAGVGKTLKVKRMTEQMKKECSLNKSDYAGEYNLRPLITIPLHSKVILQTDVLKTFLKNSTGEPSNDGFFTPRIYHIDIGHEIQYGVDHLLFNLLILGGVGDPNNYIWMRMPHDLYVIECMPLVRKDAIGTLSKQHEFVLVHQIFELLPALTCWSPVDSLLILTESEKKLREKYPNWRACKYDQTMDEIEFRSTTVQLPFQTLVHYDKNKLELNVDPKKVEGNCVECLKCLLKHCGVKDPSWSELFNFVSFLSIQLTDAQQSVFCKDFLQDDLPGFTTFVVRFMIRMSKDFATRSLNISEESPGYLPQLYYKQCDAASNDNDVIPMDATHSYGLRRSWESSPHPYLFFNSDHQSFTFLGFIVELKTQNVLDPQNPEMVIEHKIMPLTLQQALYRNKVDLNENFDNLERSKQIEKMCAIMGQQDPHDPDPTYELTTDNVKKILAIYMRFRCNIPVIIMGETGCGKTRLVKYMCDLCLPRGAGLNLQNMILMKVHGGVTEEDIIAKVMQAIEIATANALQFPNLFTVLFFDEANATEAIGIIKEIMCDHSINGRPLPSTCKLYLIAACNPYRKHSTSMIEKLEKAGLGYHVSASQTQDCLGDIPMRQLVYRVQALPQSMIPLVWDFGQLDEITETLYVRQMVRRYLSSHEKLVQVVKLEDSITNIIAESQKFMRQQKDECSFVSLRDVDRLLMVMMWFYDNRRLFFNLMNERFEKHSAVYRLAGNYEQYDRAYKPPKSYVRSLILALGVCYHACLTEREAYRRCISSKFTGPCALQNGEKSILNEITLCQDVFLDQVKIDEKDYISRNHALKENAFMIIICIELRIPLFLVGKPGSSKSLAKIIVANAMHPMIARNGFFDRLKGVQMVSYQCSPLSTPEGIVATFKQCARLQEANNKDGGDKYIAVVVLDEVGLAEDSSKMPLKTLHPLLEDGCESDNKPGVLTKVGFIGISNWALDPAKMNRGILVQRGVPDVDELAETARNICVRDEYVQRYMALLVKPLALGYNELCQSQEISMKEFFGLRDFYSLNKMVAGCIKQSQAQATLAQLKHAIMRNFDGLAGVKPVKVFLRHLHYIDFSKDHSTKSKIKMNPKSLINASLHRIDGFEGENRYLLILTENYAALGLLKQELLSMKNAVTIFGSSFRRDQEYTQVCRDINRIKMCMEAGKCVVLLNFDNLYESLYDALNQYFVSLGDKQFVDIGLGTQRVKCCIHRDFRLIVVAEQDDVYRHFPIPLINRLEKHILSTTTMLSKTQIKLAGQLNTWANKFATIRVGAIAGLLGGYIPAKSDIKTLPKVGDVFIGYHPDAAASIVLQIYKDCKATSSLNDDYDDFDDEDCDQDIQSKIICAAQDILLRCATPESVMQLKRTDLANEAELYHWKYFVEQQHDSLHDLLQESVKARSKLSDSVLLQVTTHSHLFSKSDGYQLANSLSIDQAAVRFCILQCFDTEHQFCTELKEILRNATRYPEQLFLLQCDSSDVNPDLIACARYNICNELSQESTDDQDQPLELPFKDPPVIHVVFIIQLQRIAGGYFVGFQGGRWHCYHIDDLHTQSEPLPNLAALRTKTISQLFNDADDAEFVANNDGDFDLNDQHLVFDEISLNSVKQHTTNEVGETRFDDLSLEQPGSADFSIEQLETSKHSEINKDVSTRETDQPERDHDDVCENQVLVEDNSMKLLTCTKDTETFAAEQSLPPASYFEIPALSNGKEKSTVCTSSDADSRTNVKLVDVRSHIEIDTDIAENDTRKNTAFSEGNLAQTYPNDTQIESGKDDSISENYDSDSDWEDETEEDDNITDNKDWEKDTEASDEENEKKEEEKREEGNDDIDDKSIHVTVRDAYEDHSSDDNKLKTNIKIVINGEDTTSQDSQNAPNISVNGAEKQLDCDSIREDQKRLDVEFLICSCVHNAVMCVKDNKVSSRDSKESSQEYIDNPKCSRKKQRLDLLLTLLKRSTADKDNLCLVKVLKKRIGLLLKDKEVNSMIPEQAGGWLTREVCAMEAIIRAGTFRRAIWQHLQSKINPLFAGILAHIDRCANLDLLNPVANDNVAEWEWKKTMLLEMLNDASIVPLHYRDMTSAAGEVGEPLKEFYVRNVGANDSFFQLLFPFSWIIRDKIDEIINVEKARDKEQILETVSRLLESTELGRIIDKYESYGPQLITAYIHDFVHMIYKPTSSSPDHEYQLIINEFELARSTRQHQSMIVGIIQINMLYRDVLHSLLDLFAHFNRLWPQSVSILATTPTIEMSSRIHNGLLMNAAKATDISHFNNAGYLFTLDDECEIDEKLMVFIMEMLLNEATDVDRDTASSKLQQTTPTFEPNSRRSAFVLKVKQIQPVVAQLFERCSKSPAHYTQLQQCRYMWNKVCVVQLFIEHVCLTNEYAPTVTDKKCLQLHKSLGDKTDFKSVDSLNQLELFLITINKSFIMKFGKCHQCSNVLSNPVQLPCSHAVCSMCFDELKNVFNKLNCPLNTCGKSFPTCYIPFPLKGRVENVSARNAFRRRCNAFFMELIHSLCFANNTPPTAAVVQKLLSYVITERDEVTLKPGDTGLYTGTKRMTPLEDIIDPTPVFRSFLLQLLLRASMEDVRIYIDQYLKQCLALLSKGATSARCNEKENILELCLLFVQCLEDHYRFDLLLATENVYEEEICQAFLDHVHKMISDDSDTLDLNKLEMIATIRFILAQAASYIGELEKEFTCSVPIGNSSSLNVKKRKFVQERALAYLCELDSFKWPRLYLVKLISRQIGMAAYYDLSKCPDLYFIKFQEAQADQIDAMPDRFLVCSKDYKAIRNGMALVSFGTNYLHILDIIKEVNGTELQKEHMLLLALYREVTLSYVHADSARTPQSANLFNHMIENTLPGSLRVCPNVPSRAIIVSELVVHALIVWTLLEKSKFQSPFTDFLNNPDKLQTTFLPTMPQDHLADIKEAVAPVLAADARGPTLYECPNGHAYLVTETGHILGEANRKYSSSTERTLSPAQLSIMRLLLHISMYLGTQYNLKDVHALIRPTIPVQEVEEFLFAHIQADITVIGHATGKGKDDVLLLIQSILSMMITTPDSSLDGTDIKLTTKAVRQQWEEDYARIFIEPVLPNLDDHLDHIRNCILEDMDRIGNNPLLRLIHEVDISPDIPGQDFTRIEQVSTMWRYRASISIDTLKKELFENRAATPPASSSGDASWAERYPVLRLFLKEEHNLQLLHLLPSINELQRVLSQYFGHRLSKSEATAQTIGSSDFKQTFEKDNLLDKVLKLIADFSEAWNAVRLSPHVLLAYGKPISDEDRCRLVNEDTPLAMLIPSNHGLGLCFVAVVSYLCRIQNEFMEKYSEVTRQTLETSINARDASHSQLISFDSQRDLLQMLLGNCSYVLEAGKGTMVEYDFASLERQIEERLIRGRPRIDADQMVQMPFRQNSTTVTKLLQLRKRITPQTLPMNIQREIEEGLKNSLNSVNELLARLDVTIGYLTSVTHHECDSLHDFMVNTLKLEKGLFSSRASVFQVKHVESLWLLLSHIYAKYMEQLRQESFDGVDGRYRVRLPDSLANELKQMITGINLDLFMLSLFECIYFQLTIVDVAEESDSKNITDFPLGASLWAYIESRQPMEKGTSAVANMITLPKELLVQHCVETWRLAYEMNHPNVGGKKQLFF